LRSLRAILSLLFTLFLTLAGIAVWCATLRAKLWVNYYYNLLRLKRVLRRGGVPGELREHIVELYKNYYKHSLLDFSLRSLIASRKVVKREL
jgi:hypothetical protein